MYVNKIENRIIFKIKTGYYLEHLKPKTIKLLGSTKKKKKKKNKTKKNKKLKTKKNKITGKNKKKKKKKRKQN